MKPTSELKSPKIIITIDGPVAEAIRAYCRSVDPPHSPTTVVRNAAHVWLTQRGVAIRPNKPRGGKR